MSTGGWSPSPATTWRPPFKNALRRKMRRPSGTQVRMVFEGPCVVLERVELARGESLLRGRGRELREGAVGKGAARSSWDVTH